ncbi:MAG: lytic transglycosylase domain-containing protein [Magnetococcus sp. YQC-5]
MGNTINILFCLILFLLPALMPSAMAAEEDLIKEFRRRFAVLEQEGSLEGILDRSQWPKQDVLTSHLELELLFHPHYQATPDRLAEFLERWPQHPQADRVWRVLEPHVMAKGGESAEKWYVKHAPKLPLARLQHVGGLLKKNQLDAALVLWRDLYREGLEVSSEWVGTDHPFWSKLVVADHETRARSLLNKGTSTAFKAFLQQMSKPRQDFFLALEMAHAGDLKLSAAIRPLTLTVPETRELWRTWFEALHRQGAKEKMLVFLEGAEGKQLAPEDRQRWRYLFGRNLLYNNRDFKGALRLLQENVREKGGALEDSVWLAGWSALSDGDRKRAETFFLQLAKEGVTPMGRSQGGYWAARLSDSPEQKQLLLKGAAKHLDTIYGLMAAEELGGSLPSLKNETQPVCPEGKLMPSEEEGLRLLQEVGRSWYNGPFIQKLGEGLGLLPEERLCLAIRYGAADLAIKLGAELQKKDRVFWRGLFPVPNWIPDGGWQLSPNVVWATTRQESQFFPRAESSAKALGVMQLMPETARMEAQMSRFPASTRVRLQIPGYNLALGQAYMHRMLKQFDGDLVLALVAYNAGPSRAKAWQERRRVEDPMTFIENIPFTETRNYVKRVLTGVGIYRLQLDGVASMKADMALGGPGLAALRPAGE